MKKLLLLTLTIFLGLSQPSFAEKYTAGDHLWLIAFFELQELKSKMEEKILQINLQIDQNEGKIRQVNELLAKIQRAMIEGDERQRMEARQAKPYAEEALKTAKTTQKKLKEQKMKLEWQKTQIEQKEIKLRELYSKITSAPNPAGLIKECSGNVKIIKLQGNKLEDVCSSYTPISVGDEIITSSDGRIELKILGGRGNFIVGPNSNVLIKEKKSADEDNFEVAQGKVYIKVEKTGENSKKINEYIQKYKEDLKIIKEWTDEKIEELKKEIQKFIKKLRIELCKITVGSSNCGKVPTDAVIAPRGTEFVVEREDGNIVKISVIEGEVEFTDNIKNKSDLISEGYEAIINLGETITMRKIENLERWWER